jgi:hypothetical protein
MRFLRRRNVRAQLRRLRRGVVLFLSWLGRDGDLEPDGDWDRAGRVVGGSAD